MQEFDLLIISLEMFLKKIGLTLFLLVFSICAIGLIIEYLILHIVL